MTVWPMTTLHVAYRVRSCCIFELVESWPPVMQRCMLGSLHRVHSSKRRAVLKQLKCYHAERVDIHFEIVGLMSEDLRRHISV